MSVTAGTRLGPYEILAPLGAGGMGEVYRARDTRLSRDVAVKVLPARLLENAEARTRFEREAKAVAALSHPNILAIHDFGEHEGAAYAVTELLEGETLAERLQAGPLPVRRALELAGQMADGLAAAHEKGIIHRDLKPANLFITADGRLKILDFGLARVGAAESDRTQTIALGESTEPGTVLGTVHYMSPEQVRAGVVDHRSDIFAFGIVLYEMLTGKRPFQADSAVETMNAILREEPPDSSSVNVGVPLGVDRILRRCLEKKPEMRFQSARDLAFALGNTGDSSSRSLPPGELAGVARPTPGVAAKLRPALLGLALLIAGGALGAFVAERLRPAAVIQPVKITRLTHSGRDWNPSASPDGRMLAFTSQRDGRTRIWLRQMKGGMEVPLTEGSDFSPRFSPDGSSVLFLRGEGSLREAFRVPVVGGQARRVLADVSEATWSPDGARLAFLRPSGQAVDAETAIGVADLQGGAERELSRVKGRFLYGLDWSPDGRWLSVASTDVVQNAPNNTLYLVDVKSGALNQNLVFPTRLSMPTWDSASRTLTLARSLSLVGDVSNPLGRVVRLDPLTGRERAVFWVQSVFTGGSDVVRFDSIGDSTLVFDEYDWSGSLEELDLGGALPATTGRLLTHGSSRDRQPCYSRAGDTIIFSSNRSGNLDLWTINVTTGEVRQVTDDAAEDWDPAFTVDGRGILWSSSRGGHLEIWTAAVDGTGARQLSQDGDDAENPTQTADGAFVVYASGSTGKGGIWRVRSDGTDPLKLIPGANYLPEVSPDGRYVSYALQDTPRNLSLLVVSEVATGRQVFQTSMPSVGFQAVVTPGRSRWTPDGRTLLFVATGEAGRGALYAQDFRPGQDTIASRRLLATAGGDDELESFGLSPDGRRLTIARIATSRCLKLAEGVPGLK